MFFRTKILLIFIVMVLFGQLLQADDNGFRVTPSVGLAYSYKYKESLFKPNVDVDFTYLFPVRLELGVGVGYMHDILYYNGGSVPIAGGGVPFDRWRKDSFPVYVVAKYSFDFNETDDIVLSLKYGNMYTNAASNWQNNDGTSTAQGFAMQNIHMAAVTLGYELDDTMFALDVRVTAYNQHFNYGGEDFNSKEFNGYFGLAVQKRFNLF